MRILIVEDNRQVMETVLDYLELEGFECDCAYNGEQAVTLAAAHRFDVVVADIMMARMDGVSAVREMRERLALDTPVIFLTALASLDDKAAAFAAGADDYLVKPFAMQELAMRIRALARRGRSPRQGRLREYAGLAHDPDAGEILHAGVPLRIGRIQRDILALLIERAPLRVTREEIVDAVWERGAPASDALRSHVYALRSALKNAAVDVSLETVHGSGWRLVH